MTRKKESLVIVKKTQSGFQKKPLFVVVGKNVSKKATERNTIKRRIRAIFKKNKDKNNSDITIIAQKPSATASFEELEAAIQERI